jgi:hypothetical protein
MLYTFYKIVCKDENITDCYVGSTTNFNQRKRCHKGNSKQYNCKVYQFIRDNGNWENWEMIIIDTIECETKKDAHKKENEYMIGLNATLNTYKAPIYTDKKEYNNEYMKQYRINNKEYYKEYNKEYMKQYRIDNKEYYKEYKRQYYLTKANEMLEMKQPILEN